VLEAALWGVVAASTLLIGAGIGIWRPPRPHVLGAILAFGAGVLLSAVSYELVAEAVETAGGLHGMIFGFFGGAIVFTVGDALIERWSGGMPSDQSDDDAADAAPAGLPIVLGALLDGVPESAVLGLTLLQTGEVGAAMLVAVFISNLPEGIAATVGLVAGGWTRLQVVGLWSAVVAASAVSAALGYTFLDGASPFVLASVLSFAGGAILTMLSTSMMPDAFKETGRLAGLMTVLGFGVALAVNLSQG
jgi:ZIP family zinc transporter